MVTRVLNRIPSSLDAVLAVKEELLDRELVLRGKFKDEIARLEKARSDAEEKLGMIETVEAAAKIRADADFAAQSMRQEASEMREQAASTLADALAKKKAVDQKEASVAEREAKLSTIGSNVEAAEDALVKREEKLVKAQKETERALEEGRAKFAKLDAELTAKGALLSEREKKVNERLEALKLS